MLRPYLTVTNASCHEDRPVLARGLCRACYLRFYKRGELANFDRRSDKSVSLLTGAQAAYIAGFIDGEGTISVYVSPKGYFRVIVSVANTHPDVMHWLVATLGCGRLVCSNRGQGHKPIYVLTLTGGSAVSLVGQIRPYLCVKRNQADLLLHRAAPLLGTQTVKVTADLHGARDDVAAVFRTLNQRGALEGVS